MGARTTAREAALQMLFAIDATGNDVDQAISDFWRELPGDAEGREYADQLVRGVREGAEKLDERIRAASQNWRLERMARIDRNALRLGTYELLTRTDVPRAVVLDEAVELAKRFGGDESSKFVNGVLDRIADDLGRQDTDKGPQG
ncbi:MAG TPA: transcription antitermination factor NusB [Polyangiaceae bacterium]|nr:transcription antitermination factor NusB [Polyangiaceae bacterium]